MSRALAPDDTIETANFHLSVFVYPDGSTGMATDSTGSGPVLIGYLTKFLDYLRKCELDDYEDEEDEEED